ncbi:MAG: class I SAM-dependent methyltransferase [Holosporales bacterium]|jgi:2-polyprenyl-3-methyl-5-hydroxy-6-metoxy-1,4-benzoquinol methylase|nr:class I SAM-dependent methyltransferase [Holosporales bacterium]
MNRTTLLLGLSYVLACIGFVLGKSGLGFGLVAISVLAFLYISLYNKDKVINLFNNTVFKLKKHNPQEVASRYWENCQQFGLSYLFNEPDRFMNQILFLDKEIRPRINKQSVVADIACGDGWFTVLLSRLAGSVYGYDLSPHMIKAARNTVRSLTNIKFEQFDILTNNLTRRFDAICCMGLFTYLVDVECEDITTQKFYDFLAERGGGALVFERFYKCR